MTYTFKDISTTKFSINDQELYKTFICYTVGSERIKIFNIYDSENPLIPTTLVSDIDVDGVVYATATLLANVLVDVVYARDEGGGLDSAQIEANRQAIISLGNSKADSNHNHDTAYYTKAQVDGLIDGVDTSGVSVDSSDVDGNNLNSRDSNNNILYTADVSELRSQATVVEYDNSTGVLTLKNETGAALDTATIEAKQTYYDKYTFLEGLEDDLNDLILSVSYAIAKTTSGLYFFVSNIDNKETFEGSKIYLNSNDEFFELSNPDEETASYKAWQIPISTDNHVVSNEYGFNFWNLKNLIIDGYNVNKGAGNTNNQAIEDGDYCYGWEDNSFVAFKVTGIPYLTNREMAIKGTIF